MGKTTEDSNPYPMPILTSGRKEEVNGMKGEIDMIEVEFLYKQDEGSWNLPVTYKNGDEETWLFENEESVSIFLKSHPEIVRF